MLKGFLALVEHAIEGAFANAFPNLFGIFGPLLASLLKPQAGALLGAIKFFKDQIASGASWEDAFTATLNEIGTAEYAVLTEVEKHLLHAFMQKAKV